MSKRIKPENAADKDWLITNGLGGYAGGTIAGVNTWKYHGLLVAAEAPPTGRIVMLKGITETAQIDGENYVLTESNQYDPGEMTLSEYLEEFRLDDGLPVWTFKIGGTRLERSVVMPYKQNTSYIRYTIIEGDVPVSLQLRPYVRFRGHEENFEGDNRIPFSITVRGNLYEINGRPEHPVLRLRIVGGKSILVADQASFQQVYFSRDAERGNDPNGLVWTPGYFQVQFAARDTICIVASTERWEAINALSPEDAFSIEKERRRFLLTLAPEYLRSGTARDLVLSADQLLIEPPGRLKDKAMAAARGDNISAIIAGYHWFTDWGRDTMISLEGLLLVTGRYTEARAILKAYKQYMRNGLIPNFFPDGDDRGVYHTADATLWYFHALDRYLSYTDDWHTLEFLLPGLLTIAQAHLEGTDFGIHADPADGLLVQGAEGYQLTWMDAKVDGWVVTPRRGKAVEINALWYNALRLLAGWVSRTDPGQAKIWMDKAERVKSSFNELFWNDALGYCNDVISPDGAVDPSLRPNQLFAISLTHPVLDAERWKKVVDMVDMKLITPYGPRTLSPDDASYQPKYFGDLKARDAAYHQGTVWPWLSGPFFEAWAKAYPDKPERLRALFEPFASHLNEGSVGSINEIFDAEQPYIPRGCIAQAWSVAEILRLADRYYKMTGTAIEEHGISA